MPSNTPQQQSPLEQTLRSFIEANIGRRPSFGFEAEPRPAHQSALDRIIDVLGDPRNAWMGLGPMSGMAIGKKLWGGFGNQPSRWLRPHMEEGGFNVPTSMMRRQVPALNTPGYDSAYKAMPSYQPPTGEEGVRHDFLGSVRNLNDLVHSMYDPSNSLKQSIARSIFKVADPELRDVLERTNTGRSALRGELERQSKPNPYADPNN
jgi:hypothetical protein